MESVIVIFFLPFFSQLLVNPQDKPYCITPITENILKFPLAQ